MDRWYGRRSGHLCGGPAGEPDGSARREAPHETLFAYKRAAALGTDVLEMDVRLTGDDVLVVHHDDTVDRTTDGTGRVDEKTYDELFALDHGYKFTPDRFACDDCALDQ